MIKKNKSTIEKLKIAKALKREKDKARVDALSREIANLNGESMSLKAKWQSEKKCIEEIQSKKQAIESLKLEADQAERSGDYGKVAEIRYGRIKKTEEQITALNEKLMNIQGTSALINEEVTAENIAEVVSKWTGIPVKRMLQGERDKLLHLEDELHKRVVGQDEAIAAVSDAIRRSRRTDQF